MSQRPVRSLDGLSNAFAFGTGPIRQGWSLYRRRHGARCVCSHAAWEHTGLLEPGCSHAGTCPCGRFKAAGVE